MKIVNLSIKNLKNLKDFTTDFEYKEWKNVFSIHGDNGAGKTTLLEAISLLGHLSSMTRLSVADNNKIELFSSALRLGLKQVSDLSAAESVSQTINNGTANWWNAADSMCKSTKDALIQYTLDFGGVKASFWVYFLQSKGSSITRILSSNNDDLYIEENLVLIYNKANALNMELLIFHLLSFCPHEIAKEGERKTIERGSPKLSSTFTVAVNDKEGTGNVKSSLGIVAYLNTDLNTYGLKNDLRESVKNIIYDFPPVMEERLGLKIDIDSSANTAEHSENIDHLSKSLKRVLGLQVTRLYSEHGKTTLMIKRESEDHEDGPIEYLSGGENEVFTFIFYFLWMPIKNSILLLDEPDLHLSLQVKSNFFTELFEIAKEKNCQLIFSTHSGLLLQEKMIQPLLLHKNKKGTAPSHLLDWSRSSQKKVRQDSLEIAKAALRNAGIREFVATIVTFTSNWLSSAIPESVLGWWIYFSAVIWYLILFPFFFLKILQFYSPNGEEMALNKLAYAWCITFIIVILIEWFSLLNRWRSQK